MEDKRKPARSSEWPAWWWLAVGVWRNYAGGMKTVRKTSGGLVETWRDLEAEELLGEADAREGVVRGEDGGVVRAHGWAMDEWVDRLRAPESDVGVTTAEREAMETWERGFLQQLQNEVSQRLKTQGMRCVSAKLSSNGERYIVQFRDYPHSTDRLYQATVGVDYLLELVGQEGEAAGRKIIDQVTTAALMERQNFNARVDRVLAPATVGDVVH